MAIVNQLTLSGLAGALYLLLGLHFWHTRWRGGRAALSVAQEKTAIGIALLLHAVALKLALLSDHNLHFSFSLAFSLMAWLAVLIYWLENFRVRMDGLQPIVLSVSALAVFLAILFPESRVIAHAQHGGFLLHFLPAMLAPSLFLLAAAHAIFMGLVEKRLHHPQHSRRMANMPPLLAMESLLFHMLTVAFILLTLVLGSGFFYAEALYGHAPSLNHKTAFTLISWLIFAALLAGRHIYGWRGRKALRLTLFGFVALFLAYVGSRFVLEVVLHRA